ncbi:MAG: SRPBCC family protein [Nitrospinae bacterium]|nr:SRPBCC family protein [Nitrospinota bacterium]
MNILNIHERTLNAPADKVGALIDSLASPNDSLWPVQSWPRMKFDRPLGVGAVGGHGPMGYYVENYTPGGSITFRFTRPNGFDGFHRFEILDAGGGKVTLRHTIQMTAHGMATLLWRIVIRPLHDALLEDLLANAEMSLGIGSKPHPWSPWVKLLRWIMSRGKGRTQNKSQSAGS